MIAQRSGPCCRLIFGLMLVVGLLGASATAASAHAVVVSSQPSDGERLATAPNAVTLQFNEAVRSDLAGLKVLDANGTRVDVGTDRVVGDALTVAVQPDLSDGTYIASYRVVSADGHPVKGSIVFAIGNASATVAGADVASLTGTSGDSTFEMLGAIARFLTYLGALTAAGLAFFLVFIHDGGTDGTLLGRVVRVMAIIAAIGSAGTLITQAALATGRGWNGAVDLNVLRQVMAQTLDRPTIVLIAGLAALVLGLEVRGNALRQALVFYGGLAACASFVLWGHSLEAPHRWLAIIANGTHVITAAVWLGGLIGLGYILRARSRASLGASATDAPAIGSPEPELAGLQQLDDTASIVSRFSTAAFVSLLALGVAGLVMAWIEVGTFHGLLTTTYGRLVLAKMVVVAAIAAVAAYNRFRLVPDIKADAVHAMTKSDATSALPTTEPPAHAETNLGHNSSDRPLTEIIHDDPAAWAIEGIKHLARTVLYEIIAIVLALALTSVLVNVTPARSTAGDIGIANQTLPVTTATPDSTLNLVVAPAKAGVNSVHLSYYDPQGRPIEIAGPVKIEFSLPAADLGPITRDALAAGPGHFILDGMDLSPSGLWQIVVVTRTSEFEQQRTTFTVTISS